MGYEYIIQRRVLCVIPSRLFKESMLIDAYIWIQLQCTLLHGRRGRSPPNVPLGMWWLPGVEPPLFGGAFPCIGVCLLTIGWRLKKGKIKPKYCICTEKWRMGGDTFVLRRKERARVVLYLVWQDIHLQTWGNPISFPGCLQFLTNDYFMHHTEKILENKGQHSVFLSHMINVTLSLKI